MESRDRWIFEFEASLVYRTSSRTSPKSYRVSKNKTVKEKIIKVAGWDQEGERSFTRLAGKQILTLLLSFLVGFFSGSVFSSDSKWLSYNHSAVQVLKSVPIHCRSVSRTWQLIGC